MTLLKFLDRFPPRLCRLVARERHGRKGLSQRQIAARSGLALATVSALSRRSTWRGLTVETVEAFARGCGVNLFAIRKEVRFLKTGLWLHVQRAPREQKKMYDRIMRG